MSVTGLLPGSQILTLFSCSPSNCSVKCHLHPLGLGAFSVQVLQIHSPDFPICRASPCPGVCLAPYLVSAPWHQPNPYQVQVPLGVVYGTCLNIVRLLRSDYLASVYQLGLASGYAKQFPCMSRSGGKVCVAGVVWVPWEYLELGCVELSWG